MLADVDYFIPWRPDGTKAILEIKTTNYNAKKDLLVEKDGQGDRTGPLQSTGQALCVDGYGPGIFLLSVRQYGKVRGHYPGTPGIAYEERDDIPGTGILEQLCAETESRRLIWRTGM